MPLIDLQTNLRDLKFGNDRTAEGSSQQPFIQTTLPGINESLQSEVSLSAEGVLDKITAIAPLTGTAILAAGSILPSLGGPVGAAKSAFATLAEAGRELGLGISQATDAILNVQLQLPVAGTGGVDFILRGGTLLPNKIEKDIKRLSKFFASPNGVQFRLKQNILSRLSVKTQASGDFVNDGIYSQASTLTSAGGIAFGLLVNKQTHIPSVADIPSIANDFFNNFKDFKLKNFKNDNLGLYESKVNEKGNDEEWSISSTENRLIILQNSIISRTPTTLGGIGIGNSKIGGIKLNPNATADFLGDVLLKYAGGPESYLGIGKTNIRFASERTSNAKPAPNHITLEPSGIPDEFNLKIEKQQSNPSIIDFRGSINSNYSTKNIENRLNLGSPGKKAGISTERDAGLAYSSTSYDKINALPLYQSGKVKNETSFPTTDIIPFRIGVISNDDPSNKTYIHFRAFLDNISDSYSAEWKSQKYIGRGEDLYTYGGFDRKVSLSWTVVAQSKAELIPMYKKLNYLASVVMPDYSPSGYMRGNMVTLTVGGYFNEQPGIITGFSFDMNDDSATWEIGIDENGNEDDTTSQLPHLIKVKGFNFIPIHNFVPRLQQNIFGTAIFEDGKIIMPDVPGLGDDVKYGKQHFIALTPTNDTNETLSSLYTIDDLGDKAIKKKTKAERLAEIEAKVTSNGATFINAEIIDPNQQQPGETAKQFAKRIKALKK